MERKLCSVLSSLSHGDMRENGGGFRRGRKNRRCRASVAGLFSVPQCLRGESLVSWLEQPTQDGLCW